MKFLYHLDDLCQRVNCMKYKNDVYLIKYDFIVILTVKKYNNSMLNYFFSESVQLIGVHFLIICFVKCKCNII